ncbi:MAG: DegT/DnrJ/EryC1/StrS family aminotransferase [Flavobacteriales bacterium]|nr:DegT/DnrJ/EryC1/StrS family aminotransferase [Flavobacteriales bacterium]
MDQKIVDEVTDTLLSGWITTGPKTKRFEKEISEYTGAQKTVCFNSATAGIELVLRWFGVGEGDEVIIPAYTYCATANVVVHCGAKPVMVDTLPNSFNLDPQKVREAVTERTKVIVPVDIAGFPCDYDQLWAIIYDNEIKKLYTPRTDEQKTLGRIMLMADSAHGFGAVYKGKKLGSVADGTAFSFHAVKNLTTAEGGAVCLNMPEQFDHEEMYRLLNLMSLHGQSKDALSKMQKGAWRYDVTTPGYKCNMTDIQASIGLVELARYDSETLQRRRAICALYDQEFANCDWAITPTFEEGAETETSYHLYQLRVSSATEAQRDAIIQFIAERDIAVNVHFIPLPMLTAYREKGYDIDHYPNALANYSNEISLPLFFNLTDKQVLEVAAAVKDGVKHICSR